MESYYDIDAILTDAQVHYFPQFLVIQYLTTPLRKYHVLLSSPSPVWGILTGTSAET